MKEVGGVGSQRNEVDIKKLYIDQDENFLYLFMTCSPDLNVRFEKDKMSGILAYLYIDSDNNNKTGSKIGPNPKNSSVVGAETRIWIPLGSAITYPEKKTHYTVSYFVSHWNTNEDDFGQDIADSSSHHKSSLIKYTSEGIEMAIALSDLKLSSEQEFTLICAEWANNKSEFINRKKIDLKK